ncbi:MAG: HNH/endonuclease VII fold toxin-2 domain-containing protein, partial [Candidatus Thiodiazotropha sp.]
PWTYNDRIAMAKGLKSCDKEMAEVEKHCPKDKNKQAKCPGHKKVFVGPTTRMKDRSLKGLEDYTVRIRKGESKVTKCHRALRCVLVPYEKNGKRMCCPPQTPEHLVPKACMKGVPGYISDDAPCICAEGGKSDATHGLIGDERNKLLDKKGIKLNDPCEFATLLDVGAQAAHNIFSHCSKKCIRAQLKRGAHKGISPTQPVVNKQENVRKDNSALRARLQRASR